MARRPRGAQGLGDLHRVQRRALAQVVAGDEEREAALVRRDRAATRPTSTSSRPAAVERRRVDARAPGRRPPRRPGTPRQQPRAPRPGDTGASNVERAPPRRGRPAPARAPRSRSPAAPAGRGSCATPTPSSSPRACSRSSWKRSMCGMTLNANGCGSTARRGGVAVEPGARSCASSSSSASVPGARDRLVGRDDHGARAAPRACSGASAQHDLRSSSSSGSRSAAGAPASAPAFTSGTTSGTSSS